MSFSKLRTRIVCLSCCVAGLALAHAVVTADDRIPMPSFRQHAIDPQATYSAGAAIDVNRDGQVDVVVGGAWYEAPQWTKHVMREVEFIRGRFDDYACLPLDVNADGRMDFLISNYRSEKVAWVENPGDGRGQWAEHVVERPGPMETGRLADVDGDGRPDLLPNGRDFAAWWEIVPPGSPGGEPRFVRHELPAEVVGHGVGFGDVDGDGRGDIVGPNGWLAAPEDRRQGRWGWHPEFQLDRDASVPILVADVEGDGVADIIWGRGHRTGLWWLEQSRHDGQRTWIPHAIDTSWSQPHTVELGDLNGDGRPELVAGKRYLGHDGKDPGEWDPLVIYAYSFVSSTRTWQRSEVSPEGGPAGFDLDPKLVDLDRDGDLDVLAPGRSGLYWFENLGRNAASSAGVSSSLPVYPVHDRLLTVLTADGQEQPVKSAADWARRRAHVKAHVESVMGPLPDSSWRVPLDMAVLEEQDGGAYRRLKIRFAVEPGEQVPAWLLIPKQSGRRMPAMLCLHQTTRIGKDEPAGLGGLKNLHYAHELAERGYVCIVPDYPSFGEYPFDFQPPRHKLPSGSMKAIWNNIRAVDVLETMPEVDRDRIGVIGHSLGGHNAIFTAVFDLRLRAVITSCGFTAFPYYYGGKLAGWTSDRYMPRIRTQYANDPRQVPFDFTELIAAIAPRPFFTNSPLHDSNFDVEGVRKVIATAGEVYGLLEASDRLRVEYPDCEH
ncbi:MAG: FG-GAP-like repeat-containing protein, partial [Pirellulaceae bacterium]